MSDYTFNFFNNGRSPTPARRRTSSSRGATPPQSRNARHNKHRRQDVRRRAQGLPPDRPCPDCGRMHWRHECPRRRGVQRPPAQQQQPQRPAQEPENQNQEQHQQHVQARANVQAPPQTPQEPHELDQQQYQHQHQQEEQQEAQHVANEQQVQRLVQELELIRQQLAHQRQFEQAAQQVANRYSHQHQHHHHYPSTGNQSNPTAPRPQFEFVPPPQNPPSTGTVPLSASSGGAPVGSSGSSSSSKGNRSIPDELANHYFAVPFFDGKPTAMTDLFRRRQSMHGQVLGGVVTTELRHEIDMWNSAVKLVVEVVRRSSKLYDQQQEQDVMRRDLMRWERLQVPLSGVRNGAIK